MNLLKYSYVFLIFPSMFFSCGKKTEQTKPKLTTLSESVYASVTAQPEDLYQVYASSSGILDQIFVEEGDSVKEGQVIAKIVAQKSQYNVDNAQLSVDLAKEKYQGQNNLLISLADEIKTTQKQLKLDSTNYVRQKSLWSQGVGTQLELDQAKLRYELSKGNLDRLKLKYASNKIELENSFKQSQNNLKKLENDLSDYVVRSKLNGEVYSVLKRVGEQISPQEPIAKIGKSKSFVLELMIDEVDIVNVKIGQQTIVTLDAYKGKTFDAVITKIYPNKDIKTQTFKVEAKLDQSPENLFAGLSGEANIVISQKKNTMTIPVEYLIDGQKVLTEQGEVNVKTGLSNLKEVEILSGLDTNTVILKPAK